MIRSPLQSAYGGRAVNNYTYKCDKCGEQQCPRIMTRPKEASARVAYRVFFSTQLMEAYGR